MVGARLWRGRSLRTGRSLIVGRSLEAKPVCGGDTEAKLLATTPQEHLEELWTVYLLILEQ